jgi:SAM-dependent methyltransferase
MPLTIEEWHQRFKQQAHWTCALREYIYQHSQLLRSQRILEVGSGTGAVLSSVLSELPPDDPKHIFGLDINRSYLDFCKDQFAEIVLTQGDAHNLPFKDGFFDAVFCHFLLLWVKNPDIVLHEMVRVTRYKGIVIALAEPDYGGRIDYPPELADIGELQSMSLSQQGADTNLGRKLAAIFSNAGLVNIEFGILGGQWSTSQLDHESSYEWRIMEHDLSGVIPQNRISQLRKLDTMARSSRERVLFIPTFYAFGEVNRFRKRE